MSNRLGAFRVEPANALKPERSLSSHKDRLSAYDRLSDPPERYLSGWLRHEPIA